MTFAGPGKTYASAFAMRELGFKRVLFLVHRGGLARQTIKSYKKGFDNKIKMGLVGSGGLDYDADYAFATVQTLSKDGHLEKFTADSFDYIILDEAHHSPTKSYQKDMEYFKPTLWLGMTVASDKRDDNEEGRNVYELVLADITLIEKISENML